MADTTTIAKSFTKPEIGAHPDTWGNILNGNFDLIDQAVGGAVGITISGNYTLSNAQAANLVYEFNGVLGAPATVTFPPYRGQAFILNQTGQPITCAMNTGGGTITVESSTFGRLIIGDGYSFLSNVQAVNKAGDTMTGPLTINTAAGTTGLTVSANASVGHDLSVGNNLTTYGTGIFQQSITVGGLQLSNASGNLAVGANLNVGGSGGIVYTPVGGGGADGGYHSFRLGWTGANLVVSVDGTNGIQLANTNQLGNYLLLSGGTLSGYLTVNSGIHATGEIAGDHSLATSGYVYVNGPQWSNNGGWMYTGSGLMTGGTLQANASGTALYAPNGNLVVAGTLNFGNLQISNNGGWVYSGSGFQTGGAFQANGGGTALYAPNGNLVLGGGITCTGSLGGNVGVHASYAVQADIGGTAFYAPNGNVVCQTCSANNFNNTSDAALKTDIADLPDCLDLLTAISPRRFRWREGTDKRVHWGFVAQEVEAAVRDTGHDFGGVIAADTDNPQLPAPAGLAYHELVATLWRATQQLVERVEKLEKAA